MSGPADGDDGVERSPDGRYIIVGGRRWRASDPSIPERLRAELVAELMTARRLVRTMPETARPRVHDAKTALGERGRPWWEPADPEAQAHRAKATIRALLWKRDGATLCPSEVARVVDFAHWRDLMPGIRASAVELAATDLVQLEQRGVRVDGAQAKGPIRIARGSRWPPSPGPSGTSRDGDV